MPEEKKENTELNNDIQQELSSEDSNDPKVSPEIVIGTEEIKKLEEKEHYELEYFSKDKILEENKQLGADLKTFKEKDQKEIRKFTLVSKIRSKFSMLRKCVLVDIQ